ncbi:MAG: nucleoside hydrolase-like domain-containing protein [Puniceicoccaceae bacterium]
MNTYTFLITALALFVLFPAQPLSADGLPQAAVAGHKSRLIVLSDMGNEPDEEQQILHLLMCHNEFDLEGLIAVTSVHLRATNRDAYRRVIHPERFHHLINAYEKIHPNLHRHADGWLPPFDLRLLVVSGQPEYGMAGTGEGKSTDGSELIIRQVTKDDPRPVFIVVNAGSNTLAQALIDYRATHTPEELKAFVAKLRVFENGAQDDAGAWIAHTFPDIHWIRGKYQSKAYGGPARSRLGPHVWKPFAYSTKGQDNWAHEHIRKGHGALGEVYPMRLFFRMSFESPTFIEGGGTIPWLSLVARGLTDPSEQTWGGWSGRYTASKVANIPADSPHVKKHEEVFKPWYTYTDAKDRWTDPETGEVHEDEYAAIWHWRQAFWNDFRARMDWCVKTYDEANHHPVATIGDDATEAILFLTAKIGQTLTFDAGKSTDPDGDSLRFKWWIYPEAGQRPYGKVLPIDAPHRPKVSLTVPVDAAGRQLHLILEVWDESPIVPLADYRRIVIDVN